MKAGRTLQDLAREIHRQTHAKRDYVAHTSKCSMLVEDLPTGLDADGLLQSRLEPRLQLEGAGQFGLRPNVIGQIAQYLEIPLAYLRRCMAEQPELFAANVNTWLRSRDEHRFIRTLDGHARALLSDRYATLDNLELIEHVMPVLHEFGVEIHSCEITDTKLYLQAVHPRVQAEVAPGDVVQAGVIISNSEVGAGSLRIAPLVYRLVCTNGMIVQDRTLKKKHIGRTMVPGTGDEVWKVLSEDARRKTTEAIWAQVRDVTASAIAQTQFDQVVDQMRGAKQQAVAPERAVELVESTASRYALSKGEQSSVLAHLIADGDLSRYGLLNAVTRTAQDCESYDRAIDLEEAGGRILALNSGEWQSLLV